MAEEISTHRRRLPSGPVEPAAAAVRRGAGETGPSPQTMALPQEGQGVGHSCTVATYGRTARVLIGAQGASARGTVATGFNVTEDLEGARTDFVKVGTGWVITPWPRAFHDVSPLYTQIIRQRASHGLRVHSEAFTAYIYSTQNHGSGHHQALDFIGIVFCIVTLDFCRTSLAVDF